MKVKVLFFGILAEITGIESILLSDTSDITNIKDTDEMNRTLQKKYPALKNYTYRIAVNTEMVNGNLKLSDGDEVAMLPPFAGG